MHVVQWKVNVWAVFDLAEVRGARQWSEANRDMPLYSSKDSPDAQPLVRAHFLPSSSSGSVPCKPETKKKSKKMTSLSDDTKITQRTCHPRAAAATWPCHHLRSTSWPICCKKKVCLCRLSSYFFFLIHHPFLLPSSHLLLLLHLLPSRRLQIQDKVRRSWNQRNLSWETQQVRQGLHLQVFNQLPLPPTRHVNLSVPTPLSTISPCFMLHGFWPEVLTLINRIQKVATEFTQTAIFSWLDAEEQKLRDS